MKKVLGVLALLAALVSTAAASGGKYAIVDTQSVFDKTKLGKKYQGIVREYYESRKKILDTDAEEIQKLQEEFAKQKQSGVMNEKAQREKEVAINQKIGDFQKRRDEFSGEIGKKNEELSNDFNRQLVEILKVIVKKEKVSLVMNKTINILSKAEVPAVLYADEDLDLTDKVIAEMDKQEEAKK
jgi:outer membrane protein